jgi:hypothetical protein
MLGLRFQQILLNRLNPLIRLNQKHLPPRFCYYHKQTFEDLIQNLEIPGDMVPH